MLDKYLDTQEVVTTLLKKSLKNKKLVQAYLFVCDDIDYIYNYSKDFVKEIIKSSNIDEDILNNIYNRIDNEEYTELKVISPLGNLIKKEQLLELQKSTANKPVEGNKIVYIIKNCDKLNSSSANSILKFLEEPADDIIAILLTDNINMVIPTIKSRCQVLNFNNIKNITDHSNKLKKYISSENMQLTDEEIINMIDLSIDVIQSIEKKKKNTFIYEKDLLWDKFKTNDDILLLLNIFIYSYTDTLYNKLGKNMNYMFDYEGFIDFLSTNNTEEQVILKINIINEIKNELRMNVNSKLLFDKMIIELSEV